MPHRWIRPRQGRPQRGDERAGATVDGTVGAGGRRPAGGVGSPEGVR